MERYKEDPVFQSRQKNYMSQWYKTDEDFQNRKKKYLSQRYKTGQDFQNRKKKYISQRYNINLEAQKNKNIYMKIKYASNQSYRQKKKDNLKTRYRDDPEFRLRCIQSACLYTLTKLATNAASQSFYKIQKALRITRKYRHIVTHHQERPLIYPVMEAAIASFRETIRHCLDPHLFALSVIEHCFQTRSSSAREADTANTLR